MFSFFRCNRYRHTTPRVVAINTEIRGDPLLNNVRPYVRFYLECKRCGATGTKLREAGKTYHTPEGLILDGLVWDWDDGE